MKKLKGYIQLIKQFILESYSEFKKVAWPSKDKTIRLTVYVLGVSLGVALYVWGWDVIIQKVLSYILK
ncbi:preprotein translocase subunit SecE [candidate division WWE3 bacterium RBG_19FT_COMBO_34_6]|uniref:Protein translocase subunit SecE n=1 Tax=candidate division WWE3 bacterium RBG_19FT_COMBO_34_6 TaxID=1802612 RepID=A0A1F4UKE9_UNCKA|nr:MAG: preprotein translocase subunit SecE [candidate division WWE3 bacterium RBG_19FT_COMBO_34_6]